MLYKKQKIKSNKLKGEMGFEGISIERQMEIDNINGVENQQSLTQIFYTQKKDGVLPSTNIRTDTMQLGQDAMDKVNRDFSNRIQEMKNKEIEKEIKITNEN